MSVVTTIGAKTWDMNLVKGTRWPALNFNVVDETGSAQTGINAVMNIYNSLKDIDEGAQPVKILIPGTGLIINGNNVLIDTDVNLNVGTFYHVIDVTLSNGHLYRQWKGQINVTIA